MAIGIMLLLLVAMPAFAGDTFLSRKRGRLTGISPSRITDTQLFTSLAATSPYLGATYLIDMEGNVFHKWLMQQDHLVSAHAYLLPNGNLVRGIIAGLYQ